MKDYPSHLEEVIRKLHALGLTDYEITDRLRDDYWPVILADVVKLRQRFKLKPNTRVPQRQEPIERLPKEKPDPLALAQLYLHGFDRTTMTIMENDVKRPIGLHDAIKRTNRVMKKFGLPLLTGNPLWTEGL